MTNAALKQQMESVLGQWKAGGKSLRAFAQGSGTTYSKLNYWKKRLGMTRSTHAESPFIPVEVVGAPSTPISGPRGSFEIVFDERQRIVVPFGFDATELRRLLSVIRSC